MQLTKQAVTLGDVLQPVAKATALAPGYLPSSMTGPGPNALVGGLMGLGLGKYVASPILKRMYPDLDEEGIERLATYGGGAAGAMPGLLMSMGAYSEGGVPGLFNKYWEDRDATRKTDMITDNALSGAALSAGSSLAGAVPGIGPLLGPALGAYASKYQTPMPEMEPGPAGYKSPKPRQAPKPMSPEQLKKTFAPPPYEQESPEPALDKQSGFYNEPVNPSFFMPNIAQSGMMDTLAMGLQHGTIGPQQAAAAAKGVREAAGYNSTGNVSPAALAFASGAGALGLNTVARAAGALGQAIGLLKPGTQQMLAQNATLGGALLGGFGYLMSKQSSEEPAMTKKQAFALGYLTRLAQHGYTPSTLMKSLEKKAEGELGPLSAVANAIGGGVARSGEAMINAASKLGPYAAAAAVGVPLLGGTLTGWMHSGLADVSPEDIERRKEQDYIDAYRSEAQNIRAKIQREKKWRKQIEAAQVS